MQETFSRKMKKQMPFTGLVCLVMLFVVYRTTNYQHHQTEVRFIFFTRMFSLLHSLIVTYLTLVISDWDENASVWHWRGTLLQSILLWLVSLWSLWVYFYFFTHNNFIEMCHVKCMRDITFLLQAMILFASVFQDFFIDSKKLNGLPRGIVQPRSDLELKPLWSSSSRLRVCISYTSIYTMWLLLKYFAPPKVFVFYSLGS